MNRQLPLALLALGVSALCGLAQAAESVAHNDMDGDGRSDLVWRNSGSGTIVYWSAANPAADTKVVVTMPSRFPLSRMTLVGTGVFSAWFTSDLLLQDPVDGMVYDLYSNGAGYTASATGWCCTLGSPWRLAGVGDFDGDTFSDLVYRDEVSGANWWFSSLEWYGLSSLAPVTNLAWKVAGVGNFDGDNVSDILWRNATTGQNAIWRSANRNTQLHVATVSDLAWKIASVADFNGDGRSDIFWRNSITGANSLWPSANVAARRAPSRSHRPTLAGRREWRLQRRPQVRRLLAQQRDGRQRDLVFGRPQHPLDGGDGQPGLERAEVISIAAPYCDACARPLYVGHARACRRTRVPRWLRHAAWQRLRGAGDQRAGARTQGQPFRWLPLLRGVRVVGDGAGPGAGAAGLRAIHGIADQPCRGRGRRHRGRWRIHQWPLRLRHRRRTGQRRGFNSQMGISTSPRFRPDGSRTHKRSMGTPDSHRSSPVITSAST